MRDIRRLTLMLIMVVCLLASAEAGRAVAATITAVTEDFSPLTGTLVMPLNSQWLIDQDSSSGVASGDLFSVIQLGAPVIHPVTKEILGRLETVRAVLQVEQVKAGYSYASVVSQQGELKPGDAIKRYSGLPAQFRDETGVAGQLYTVLRNGLPHLTWQDNKPALTGAGLQFVFAASGLSVLDQAEQALHHYSPQTLGLATSAAPAPAALIATSTAPVAGAVALVHADNTDQAGGSIVRQSAAQQDGLWRSAALVGEPVGVEVADFDGDGQQEIAIAFRDRLEVGRLKDGDFNLLVSHALPKALNFLTLDGADLDNDGRTELYLSAVRGVELASLVLSVEGSRLAEVASGVPYLFRTVTLVDEGPVLLGQSMNMFSGHFKGPIFRVMRRGDKISQGNSIQISEVRNLYSFQPLASENSVAVAKLHERSLQVVNATGTAWNGVPEFGGSEIYYQRPDAGKSTDVDSIPVYMAPRLALADNGTLLAPAHGRNMLGSLLQTYTEGSVVALRWNGTSLQEVWRTRPQNGYLADYRLADADNDGQKEVVGAFTFAHKGFMSKASSALLVFELN